MIPAVEDAPEIMSSGSSDDEEEEWILDEDEEEIPDEDGETENTGDEGGEGQA